MEHHNLCARLESDPSGIKKPCNCGAENPLAHALADAVTSRYYLTTSLGYPDCGPIFLDDDDAMMNVRQLIAAELEKQNSEREPR